MRGEDAIRKTPLTSPVKANGGKLGVGRVEARKKLSQ